uniref:Uncharacterized protein n=1 Tax=viral metagenome TaxID=1070528 RepID=A0A6C0C1W4_9ZZZZ
MTCPAPPSPNVLHPEEICETFDELSSAVLRKLAAEAQNISDTVCIEERTITLDSCRKTGLIKDIPVSLDNIRSEVELRRYSLDALKKLARAENLLLEKSFSRERVVQALEQLRVLRQPASTLSTP